MYQGRKQSRLDETVNSAVGSEGIEIDGIFVKPNVRRVFPELR